MTIGKTIRIESGLKNGMILNGKREGHQNLKNRLKNGRNEEDHMIDEKTEKDHQKKERNAKGRLREEDRLKEEDHLIDEMTTEEITALRTDDEIMTQETIAGITIEENVAIHGKDKTLMTAEVEDLKIEDSTKMKTNPTMNGASEMLKRIRMRKLRTKKHRTLDSQAS